MRKFVDLQQEIIHTYRSPNLEARLSNKYESDAFQKWDDGFSGLSIGKVQFLSDGSSEHPCFTKIAVVDSIKTENVFFTHYCHFHKSILGDYVTFYGVLRCQVNYPEQKIHLPKTIITSPIGPFAELFPALWKSIKVIYPNCHFFSYHFLQEAIKEIPREENTVYDLLFGYEAPLSKHYRGDSFFSPDR
ncbi:MAG: hypothetical protein AAFQ92_21885 [Bacteroidota bacterium]